MALRARNDIHLARRIWHFCGVMTVFILYTMMNPQQAIYTAVPISIFMIGFDFFRLRNKQLNRFFMWLFGPFLRESERHRWAGSTAMMAGITLIIAIFPKGVVLLALLFFAVADPMASYFGIRFGKERLIGNKTLQGSMAAFGASFLVALLYCTYFELMTERLFMVCVLAGFIGAVSELVPIWRLDDNFVFPVLSATLLTGLFFLFGGL